jgi:ATP-dependent Clp protease ATP-binding subunit ClpA
MMNNFTPRAQQVLALARKEADRFNHNYVGTEHLLLGLIKLGQGVAVNVLTKLSTPCACRSSSRSVPGRTRRWPGTSPTLRA